MSGEYNSEQLEALIDLWITGFRAERNRAILKRRLIDGVAFEKIAEEFGLSTRHVKRIVYSAQERLFKHV